MGDCANFVSELHSHLLEIFLLLSVCHCLVELQYKWTYIGLCTVELQRTSVFFQPSYVVSVWLILRAVCLVGVLWLSASTNVKSISSAIFVQLTAECHWACRGMFYPLIIAPCTGIWAPSDTCFLGPTRVHDPSGSRGKYLGADNAPPRKPRRRVECVEECALSSRL